MKLSLFTDGGARGNPGPGAAGAVLVTDSGEKIKELGKFLGVCTNNEAEYQALIMGLTACKEKDATEVICFLDSELIVKQLLGEYRVKSATLAGFYKKVLDLARGFKQIEYKHIRREKNKDADRLVNEVLDSI